MSFINYTAKHKVLVMTKGHPFNREDFFSVFDRLPDIEATAVEQPAAQVFFNPEQAKAYDAFVLYDMPGMNFMAAASDGVAPEYIDPPVAFQDDFLHLLALGHGFVFLHHSIAAWPSWPEYAEIVGGKFLYRPDVIEGQPYPDDGYRHEVDHTVTVTLEHPVTTGVSPQFSITDELYLNHVFHDAVIPILTSDYDYCEDNFYSAQQAVKGNLFSREGWRHQPGHNLIGWIKHYRNSPIVYLQCGDSQSAYENLDFQRLLSNAIKWVSSDEAKRWARSKNH
ncbi:ThuA domain-containing protein [Oceanicoccus sp. KOV_DT_Chl]|uniref:ThuA domain-containing protein n=1 Tax=Oceanicoccus sp. KOV_DT_Chl TaxID=1904639 RepID=UPI000C7BED48|nr:ThuA domain-containing protein [Oceanicoccus sp. KOV_DT_Chl]